MHQRPTPWLALCGGLAAAAVDAQATLARGPALCRLQPTAAVVQWTSSVAGSGEVAWGPTPALGLRTPPTAAQSLHEVAIGPLQPGAPYWYQVHDGATPLAPVYSFRAPTGPEHPFVRLAAFGDAGTGSLGQYAVARLAADLQPDLVLMPGDINYPYGDAATLDQNFFVPYAALLPTVPFYLSPGNHDHLTACGQPYRDAFCLPTSSSGGEDWYSFDVGDVHVVSADSETLPLIAGCGSSATTLAQLAWLDQDLAASTTTWKIVFLHRPGRSSSTHGGEPLVQLVFEPLLEARGVDLLIAGHDHCYQRFPRLVGGVPDPRGPVHVVVGTGGAGLYPVTPSPLLAAAASTFGLLLLDVAGNQLRLRFVDAAGSYGRVLDDVTLQKGSGFTPSLQATAAALPPGGSLGLAVLGSPGQPWWLLAALQPGCTPLPPHGTIGLGPGPLLLGSGITDEGHDGVLLTAPPVPALSGLRVHCQALAGSLEPNVGGLRLTNAVLLTVR